VVEQGLLGSSSGSAQRVIGASSSEYERHQRLNAASLAAAARGSLETVA
jgi:hypothetical protein